MDQAQLDELLKLEAAATPGPWHFCVTDDHHCTTMVVVSTDPNLEAETDIGDGKTIVAATLVQTPRCVDHEDKRWDENATLIAAMRNNLRELVHLARIGLATRS